MKRSILSVRHSMGEKEGAHAQGCSVRGELGAAVAAATRLKDELSQVQRCRGIDPCQHVAFEGGSLVFCPFLRGTNPKLGTRILDRSIPPTREIRILHDGQ